MFIYQVIIEYDGTNFVGWQIQKNGMTVQEAIQKTLTKILKQKITLYGSGRTDSGVHALGQSAHFIVKKNIDNKFVFLNTLNFFLNKKKISILEIKKKKQNFHARYSAKKRTYKYIIINRLAPLSLDINKAWHVKSFLNIIVILFSFFVIITPSKVLIGDFAPHEEALKVEKSFFPSKSLAAFFISLIFRADFICQALFTSRDSGAIRLTIKYL